MAVRMLMRRGVRQLAKKGTPNAQTRDAQNKLKTVNRIRRM